MSMQSWVNTAILGLHLLCILKMGEIPAFQTSLGLNDKIHKAFWGQCPAHANSSKKSAAFFLPSALPHILSQSPGAQHSPHIFPSKAPPTPCKQTLQSSPHFQAAVLTQTHSTQSIIPIPVSFNSLAIKKMS